MTSAVGLRIIHKNTSRKIVFQTVVVAVCVCSYSSVSKADSSSTLEEQKPTACKSATEGYFNFDTPSTPGFHLHTRRATMLVALF